MERMVQTATRNLPKSKMKTITLAAFLLLTGCATADANYLQYLEQTGRLTASQNAAEAACLLVIAEGMKTGDSSTKAVLSSQIDKCKKETIKLVPPKNWLGF
jgi:PBP1b-binding outer membrane lipoprotein LpoB